MTKVYRQGSRLLREVDGVVTNITGYKSINRAKKANRGNITAPVLKPVFAEKVGTEEVK